MIFLFIAFRSNDYDIVRGVVSLRSIINVRNRIRRKLPVRTQCAPYAQLVRTKCAPGAHDNMKLYI
jgi:hypothetical protein